MKEYTCMPQQPPKHVAEYISSFANFFDPTKLQYTQQSHYTSITTFSNKLIRHFFFQVQFAEDITDRQYTHTQTQHNKAMSKSF